MTKHPQDVSIAMNDQASPQGLNSRTSIIAATAISKIQLNDTIKNSITSALQRESPFSEILTQLQGGARQYVLNNLIFKQINSSLAVYG